MPSYSVDRLDRLALTGTLQYNDDANDLFEREPYSTRFRPVGAGRLLYIKAQNEK